jgi:hypothetical protein
LAARLQALLGWQLLAVGVSPSENRNRNPKKRKLGYWCRASLTTLVPP